MLPIAKLNTTQKFIDYTAELGINLPLSLSDENNRQLFSQSIQLHSGKTVGNRFCIHPMEGWDGTPEGKPTDHTFRRWRNFGRSGAKLIWGGEAVAVCHDGRANPNQLLLNQHTQKDIEALRLALLDAHQQSGWNEKGLVIGLQLTHSGRFSRPNEKTKLEPIIAYHHHYLDHKFNIPREHPVISDTELEELIQNYVKTAVLAQKLGYDFVDIKHCHGYLGHELLSALHRPGRYGGSFENRTRFLREIVAGIQHDAPGLEVGVRLSMFDLLAFEPDPITKTGIPVSPDGYPKPFGSWADNFLAIDLDEPKQFLQILQNLNIQLVNLTAGSPYYNPHIQRPAMFPPSDGYRPPEDPLVGVARQITAAAQLKEAFPGLVFVGTAYTYLQEWLPFVAAGALQNGMIDSIGLGRMVLSYPEFPSDVLAGHDLNRKRLCRTFSDCTTAPRCGLVSGCYPLDHYYKDLPESLVLAEAKKK